MRRQDRKRTDSQTIRAILDAAQVFSLALADPASPFPYVLPLNYGYEFQGDRLTLYFHGALAGRKYELLKEGVHPAGFALHCRSRLLPGETAQETSYAYQSLVGEGWVRQLMEPEEKRHGLEVLMACLTQRPWEIQDAVLLHTAVFALDVEHFEAKENQPSKDRM